MRIVSQRVRDVLAHNPVYGVIRTEPILVAVENEAPLLPVRSVSEARLRCLADASGWYLNVLPTLEAGPSPSGLFFSI